MFTKLPFEVSFLLSLSLSLFVFIEPEAPPPGSTIGLSPLFLTSLSGVFFLSDKGRVILRTTLCLPSCLFPYVFHPTDPSEKTPSHACRRRCLPRLTPGIDFPPNRRYGPDSTNSVRVVSPIIVGLVGLSYDVNFIFLSPPPPPLPPPLTRSTDLLFLTGSSRGQKLTSCR